MPKVETVVNGLYWGLLWLVLAGPTCAYLVICRCMCGRGPSKSDNGASKVSATDYSSSARDVLKKDQ